MKKDYIVKTDEETSAVIAAAISAYLGKKSIAIKNITPIKKPKIQGE